MPPQRPGQSKQDYATPREFLDAIRKRFGVERFVWDLAANKQNSVTNVRHYFGPDHLAPACRDALADTCLWRNLKGDLWLNPPYAHIEPWAEKCVTESLIANVAIHKQRIFFLVPAAVGSNWYARHVHGKALVLFLSPRLSFDGKAPYPKDCLLAVYGEKPGAECWRWKK